MRRPGIRDENHGRFAPVIPSVRFDRPIFILAPPRSGSTLLFDCLAQFAGVFHLRSEADGIWWQVFPHSENEQHSDFVGCDRATPTNVRAIRWLTYRAAVLRQLRDAPRYARRWQFARFLLGRRAVRYLDKTIANCFHLEFLEQAFPDAQFVFLVRDPRANISSMLESWSHPELAGKPQLDQIVRSRPDATVEHWSFPAPPGWQSVLSWPLPRICAWIWQQHIEYAQRFFQQTGQEKMLVRYEDLMADGWATMAGLAAGLDLDPTAETRKKVEAGAMSRTVISRPYPGKWKDKSYQEIESVLPMVRETAALVGYQL